LVQSQLINLLCSNGQQAILATTIFKSKHFCKHAVYCNVSRQSVSAVLTSVDIMLVCVVYQMATCWLYCCRWWFPH